MLTGYKTYIVAGMGVLTALIAVARTDQPGGRGLFAGGGRLSDGGIPSHGHQDGYGELIWHSNSARQCATHH